MNKDLNAEIEQMATKLEKASETPSEKLFSVIKSLGPEGLREKMSTLNDDEKVVLKAALEEMTLKKAVSFDKEIQSAKVIQGNIMDTIIQEEIGSDDADEKLMKPEAAHQNHQGNPTDGWEGQVIKASKEEKEAEDKKKKEKDMKKADVIEAINKSDDLIDHVVSTLLEKGMKEKDVHEKCAEKGMDKKKVMGAVDKFKSKKQGNKKAPGEFGAGEEDAMEKAEKEAKEKASKKIMDMEEKEHGTKDPKKLVEAEKKEHMKKGEIAEVGNPEQDQVGDTAQMTAESKDLGDETQSAAKANKKTQEQVNNTKVEVKKACNWEGEDRLLKANTQGRNFNFNLEQFADEVQKATTTTSDDLKKSSGKEDDLNDLIAKSEDKSWDQVKEKRQKEENEKKKNGKMVKSFDDVADLAALYGISQAEAKKIMES